MKYFDATANIVWPKNTNNIEWQGYVLDDGWCVPVVFKTREPRGWSAVPSYRCSSMTSNMQINESCVYIKELFMFRVVCTLNIFVQCKVNVPGHVAHFNHYGYVTLPKYFQVDPPNILSNLRSLLFWVRRLTKDMAPAIAAAARCPGLAIPSPPPCWLLSNTCCGMLFLGSWNAVLSFSGMPL